MGKSTINSHFPLLFVCSPGRVISNKNMTLTNGKLMGSHGDFLMGYWAKPMGDEVPEYSNQMWQLQIPYS